MQEATHMENSTAKHPVTPGEVLPAGELLGDLFLAMNSPSEALKAYENDLERHPNRLNGLYGAAMAAKAIGNKQKATQYFELLLSLTKNSNQERQEIREAREFIGTLSL
jgi:tetratricopeptide (TPR) repeat protein